MSVPRPSGHRAQDLKAADDSALTATTSAVRIHRFGTPEVMVFEEIARPVPAPGQVLVEVKAAGVGAWDALVRSGSSALGQALPITLGAELSGVVLDVGPGVEGFGRGEAVFGATNRQFVGAYARHAVAAADMLAPKPETLDFAEAASVPVVAVTAWQMLFDYGAVTSGTRVLVLGAAGNVGAYAVQLAHHAGATVISMTHPADAPYVRDLGSDDVVDYPLGVFTGLIAPVDVVLDTVGGDLQVRAFAVVKPGGIVVSVVSQPRDTTTLRTDVRTSFFIVDIKTAYLNTVARDLTSKKLRPNVGLLIPLRAARRAHEMLAAPSGRPRGKIVLTVDD